MLCLDATYKGNITCKIPTFFEDLTFLGSISHIKLVGLQLISRISSLQFQWPKNSSFHIYIKMRQDYLINAKVGNES